MQETDTQSVKATFAELSPNTLFVYQKGAIVYLNPTGAHLCGLKNPNDAIGHSFSSLAHPLYKKEVAAALEPFLNKKESGRLESQLWVSPNGRVYYLDVYTAPILWEGKLASLVIANDDTSYTRGQQEHEFMIAADDALTDTMDLRARMQGLVKLIVPTFADWCSIDLVYANELKPIAVMHKDPTKIELTKELRKQYPAYLDDTRGIPYVLRTGQTEFHSQVTDAMLKASARDQKHLELLKQLGLSAIIIVPLIVRDKKIGVLTMAYAESHKQYTEADFLLAEEIADRAAVAIDNARLHQEIRADDAAKSDFLAILAHELRNPLAAMLSSLQLLLLQESHNSEVKDIIHSLQRQTQFIKRLLDDLLDIARITRGEIRLKKEVFDLGEIIRAALETTHSVENIRTTHSLDIQLPSQPVYIQADPIRIEQAVVNLLNNAAKYTDAGGSITLTCTTDQDAAYITIKDTGIGLDPDIKQDLFKLFRRSEAVRHKKEGLGVGLRLVKTIIELHDGWVKAESEGVGKGSTFTVMLPLTHQQALPLGEQQEPTSIKQKPDQKETKKRKVLIIDDNKDAAGALCKLLSLLGHSCTTRHSAADALELLKQQDPECIIMDIGLPEMNGYELARAIRQSDLAAKNATLIALTGYGSEDDKARAKQAGFNHHLTKPVELERLKEILAQ